MKTVSQRLKELANPEPEYRFEIYRRCYLIKQYLFYLTSDKEVATSITKLFLKAATIRNVSIPIIISEIIGEVTAISEPLIDANIGEINQLGKYLLYSDADFERSLSPEVFEASKTEALKQSRDCAFDLLI